MQERGPQLLGTQIDYDVVKATEQNETLDPISMEQLYVAMPHGPCYGVNAAISVALEALEIVDGREPIYTFNPIVHNDIVNKTLEGMGLITIWDRVQDDEGNWRWDWSKIPPNSLHFFSAHGHTEHDDEMASKLGLLTMDATCRLVDGEQRTAVQAVGRGETVIYYGSHVNNPITGETEIHPETLSVISRAPGKIIPLFDVSEVDSLDLDTSTPLRVMNQTTMQTDIVRVAKSKLEERFDSVDVGGRHQGCYATDNRQDAVVKLAQDVDAMVVVTGTRSNNGKNLVERARRAREDRETPSYGVITADNIDWSWFSPESGIKIGGISSAASTPESLLEEALIEFARRGVEIKLQDPVAKEDPLRKFDLKRANIDALRARYQ